MTFHPSISWTYACIDHPPLYTTVHLEAIVVNKAKSRRGTVDAQNVASKKSNDAYSFVEDYI